MAPSARGADYTGLYDTWYEITTTNAIKSNRASRGAWFCSLSGNLDDYSCSLRAALHTVNDIPESFGHLRILISVADNFSGTISTPNTPAYAPSPSSMGLFPDSAYMTNGSGSPDSLPAHFQITRSKVVIDFMNRLHIAPAANNSTPAITFQIDAPNVTLRNLKNISSNRTSIVFGPNSDGSVLEDSEFINTSGSAAKEAILIRPGADNITIRNTTFSRSPGTPGTGGNPGQGGMIRVSKRNDPSGLSTVANLTLDNVLFDNTPVGGSSTCGAGNASGCAAAGLFAEGDVTLTGLTVKNSRFNYFPAGLNAIDLTKASGASSGIDIRDNTFSNIKGGSHPQYSAIQLPSACTLAGASYIRNNVFDNSGVSGQNHAISWCGAYQPHSGAWTNRASNLTIENNYFNGYEGQTILLNKTGAVTVQRNTFGPATASQSDTQLEETLGLSLGNTVPTMLMNYQHTANRRLLAWYPTSADVINCVLNVDVEPPASNSSGYGQATTPVRLDFYHTAGITAETYLGSVGGITNATTVTLDALPDDPGYIRLQTQSPGPNGQLESSQYSRTVAYAGSGDCRTPKVAIDLRAWTGVDESNGPPTHDAIVGGEVAAAEKPTIGRIPEGDPVWFTYTVSNPGWLPTIWNLVVRDDYGDPICLIPELAPQASQGCALRVEADELS
jgi:hypothetical protein